MPLAPVGTGGTDPTPPARYGHAMAYDSQSGRLVLFGGGSSSAGVLLLLNDTWAYDFNTSTWTDMSPAIAPPARYGHAMAYDSESDRVILFGGWSYGNAVFNDTWAYDFNTNTWNEVSPKSSPLARSLHVMAYDSESDRVILFGGYSSCCLGITLGDTWAYDFNTNTWTAMNPAVAPGPRESSAMAYDSRSDRVILFGGYGGSNETWAYDFNTNTWTDTNPVVEPPGRWGHALAYDSQSDRVILFGGGLYDTWAYDFNGNIWTDMAPASSPLGRESPTLTYDSAADRVVLFGGTVSGRGDSNETWAYDFQANAWADMARTPPARYGHAMAYDSQSDRIILFGGWTGTQQSNDTWAYDFKTNTWTDLAPVVGPRVRAYHAMAYDSQSDRVILFGGYGGYNDTWAYDFNANTWTDMAPATSPPGRYLHAMAYDSQSDRVILFGGYGGYNDTWAYDFNANTWTDMAPATSPPALVSDAMAYDSAADRVILFGGDNGTRVSNDTWAYDFNANTWTDMAPATSPPGRDSPAMAYDSSADRAILFGGAAGILFNDTWAYDLGTNTWTNMSAAPAPSGRHLHGMAYDSQSNRVILFGGVTAYSIPLEDTWTYDLNANGWTNVDAPVPLSAPRALGALSGNAQVRLDWQAPASDGGSSITGYNVYRGFASGTLVLLSSVGPVLTYQDAGLTNGVAYYYQVAAVTAAGEGPRSSEVAATPRTQPSAALNLVATPSAARVVLTWSAPISDGGAPLTGYSIYRGTAPASSTFLASVGNVLTYADDAVTNGVTYYYQAAALNLAGEGPRSNEVSATPTAPPDSTPPTAAIGSLPNNTVVNSTTITLTGTASDNVAIEKVEVSADGSTWILATGTTSWSATLTLREGQNTIFVRTTDTSGNVSITTFTVTVELASLTLQGTSSLAIDRVAGGAAVTAAIVVGVYVSSSVGSGSSGVSAASGGMTHKGIPLPWKRLRRF
ncbi:MAG: hypothetical protein E6K71_06845, partial [Candidatus Eisenbacteria bacterium]